MSRREGLRLLAAGVLTVWLCLFLHWDNTEKSMIRSLLVETKDDSWTVGLLYQFPEASADSSEAEAAIRLCVGRGPRRGGWRLRPRRNRRRPPGTGTAGPPSSCRPSFRREGSGSCFSRYCPSGEKGRARRSARLRPEAAAPHGGSLCSLRARCARGPPGKPLTEQPRCADKKTEAKDRRRQPEEQECGIEAGDAPEAPRPQKLIARIALRRTKQKCQPQRIAGRNDCRDERKPQR